VLLQTVLVAAVWWPGRRRTTPLSWRWSIPTLGMLLVVADALYFSALAQDEALVSVVSVVRRSNVLVSFTLGSLLFREQLLRQKALALLGVLLGLSLLLGSVPKL
jgi:transporter family protein